MISLTKTKPGMSGNSYSKIFSNGNACFPRSQTAVKLFEISRFCPKQKDFCRTKAGPPSTGFSKTVNIYRLQQNITASYQYSRLTFSFNRLMLLYNRLTEIGNRLIPT